MSFLIADTFTTAFGRLPGLDQATKASVFDLRMDAAGAGLQPHRTDKSKDANFWSTRVNRVPTPLLPLGVGAVSEGRA